MRRIVFLNEVGEIGPSVQVKLLRVMRSRTFQRLGETRDRRFHGKLVAATNRSLSAEIDAGRFREDLYYRLCADMIETPSLADQLRDSPGELSSLLRFVAPRAADGSPVVRLVPGGAPCPGRAGPGSPAAVVWSGPIRPRRDCR